MKNKNKMKYLTLSILLTGAVGFSTLAVKQVQVKAESENVVNINKENKKLVSYDDQNYEVTLDDDELLYKYTNLFNLLVTKSDSYVCNIVYDTDTYDFDEILSDSISWTSGPNNINLYYDLNSQNHCVFQYYDGNEDQDDTLYQYSLDNSITTTITIVCSNATFSEVKSAIELDIQANESSYGESIITAISSGLGLIPNLAQEFLTGFTTLFWDSAQEKLTDFGTFALVFLGVAITMAVVKLCLAILRSNTGA